MLLSRVPTLGKISSGWVLDLDIGTYQLAPTNNIYLIDREIMSFKWENGIPNDSTKPCQKVSSVRKETIPKIC